MAFSLLAKSEKLGGGWRLVGEEEGGETHITEFGVFGFPDGFEVGRLGFGEVLEVFLIDGELPAFDFEAFITEEHIVVGGASA